MNITLHSCFAGQSYEVMVKDDRIIYKDQTIHLNSLVLVEYYRNYTEGWGAFCLYYGNRPFKKVFFNYCKEGKNGEKVADFLLKFIGEERFIDSEKEPNSEKMNLVEEREILFTVNYGENGTQTFSICNQAPSFPGSFFVRQAQTYTGTYHPEKIVYTGATVGGVHTGGIHKEEAYVSTKSSANGNGYIEIVMNSSWKERVDSITLPKRLLKEAKKNPVLAELIKDDKIMLLKPVTYEQSLMMQNAVMGGYNAYSQIDLANILTSRYVSYDQCVEVERFLNRVLVGEFHPELSEVFEKIKETQRKNARGLIGCLAVGWILVAAIISFFVLALNN